MISLKEKDDNTKARVVVFGTDGIITKISTVVTGDETNYAWFEFDTIRPFLTGEYKFSDYVVTKTKNPLIYQITKKSIDFKSRSSEKQIQKVTKNDDPELTIKFDGKRLEFTLNKKLVDEANVVSGNEVLIAGNAVHPFHITFKDKPDFILKTVTIPYTDLFCGETVSLDFNYDPTKISIYTKKYFNTYSMEQ